MESQGLAGIDLGPDEHRLVLHGEPELKSAQQKHVEKLQNDLIRKKAELDAIKLRVQLLNNIL